MTDSLRDQLLGLGFKPAPKPERKPAPKPSGAPAREHARKPQPRQPQSHAQPRQPRKREDIDLAKAYALRAQREKDERIEAERRKQEDARQRREARAKVAELVQGQSLNVAEAEIARHFPYGGKLKRVYVTESQLRALNAG